MPLQLTVVRRTIRRSPVPGGRTAGARRGGAGAVGGFEAMLAKLDSAGARLARSRPKARA